MEQALSQLEKLEGARTREDFIATLNRAGFSIMKIFQIQTWVTSRVAWCV